MAQPQMLEFGTVYVREKSDSQALTIAVPEDSIIGQEYDLIWIFYGRPPDEEEPRDTAAEFIIEYS